MSIDYYGVLNLASNATDNQIRESYRKYAILLHPTRKPYPRRCGENPAEFVRDRLAHLPKLTRTTAWKLVNEAFDILSNPLLKAVYDLYGEQGLKEGVPAPDGFVQPYVYHGDYMKTFKKALATESPYADLIDAVTCPPENLFTVNTCRGIKTKEPDIETILYLDLEEIFFGCLKKVMIMRQEFVDGEKLVTAFRDKLLAISIPVGTLPGTKFRFTEEGDQGPMRIPADVVFITADKQHPIYERKNGHDLHMNYPITLRQSYGGFVLPIRTIDDRKFHVAITEVVQPNDEYLIEDEGMVTVDDPNKKGNLIVHFLVDLPKVIPDEFLQQFLDLLDKIQAIEQCPEPRQVASFLDDICVGRQLN